MDMVSLRKKILNSYLPVRYKNKLCSDLEKIFQYKLPELSRIVLFGSCARNQIRVGSDIDLLLLTKQPVAQGVRGGLAAELEEPVEGVSTDVIFYTEDTFRASECRLVQEIQKDGLILWESENV